MLIKYKVPKTLMTHPSSLFESFILCILYMYMYVCVYIYIYIYIVPIKRLKTAPRLFQSRVFVRETQLKSEMEKLICPSIFYTLNIPSLENLHSKIRPLGKAVQENKEILRWWNMRHHKGRYWTLTLLCYRLTFSILSRVLI